MPRPIYPRGKSPRYPLDGWVGPRANLDDVEKRKFLILPGLELRTLGRPARSQSLYRLRYPGSLLPQASHSKLFFPSFSGPTHETRGTEHATMFREVSTPGITSNEVPPSIFMCCHVLECDYRRGLDGWVYLLTTHTHDSAPQAITAPPLISTIHKSPQHPLSIFRPAVSSPAVPWQRLLIVEIVHLHALKSSLHRLPCRTDFVATIVLLTTPRHGPHRNTLFLTLLPLLGVDSLLRERFTELLPRNGPGIPAHLPFVA
jgi:hypothetical protein